MNQDKLGPLGRQGQSRPPGPASLAVQDQGSTQDELLDIGGVDPHGGGELPPTDGTSRFIKFGRREIGSRLAFTQCGSSSVGGLNRAARDGDWSRCQPFASPHFIKHSRRTSWHARATPKQ